MEKVTVVNAKSLTKLLQQTINDIVNGEHDPETANLIFKGSSVLTNLSAKRAAYNLQTGNPKKVDFFEEI